MDFVQTTANVALVEGNDADDDEVVGDADAVLAYQHWNADAADVPVDDDQH